MDIRYLLFLQSLRNASPQWLQVVFYWISEFIHGYLPIGIMAIIYWCLSKRMGTLMLMQASGANFVTQTVKNIACVYRPWVKDPAIIPYEGTLKNATGYSFPSGHSTAAVGFYGLLAKWAKDKKRIWAAVLCIVLMLLTCFSRNWLGAHTPQDVIAAMALALVCLLVFSKLLRWVDAHPEKDVVVAAVAVVLCVAMVIFALFRPYPMDYNEAGELLVDPFDMITDCMTNAALFGGFMIGWCIERRCIGFKVEGSAKDRVLRAVIGLIIVLGVKGLTSVLLKPVLHVYAYKLISYTLVALSVTVMAPPVFMAVEKRRKG